MLLTGETELIEGLIKKISTKYDITTDQFGTYLGIDFTRQPNKIVLSCKRLIEKMVGKFGMINKIKAATPLPYYKFNLTEENVPVDQSLYLPFVNSLNYLAINVRPDVITAASILSQRSQDPHVYDLIMLKYVLTYLHKTKDMQLVLEPKVDNKLVFYVDASHNGKYDNGYSRTGFIVMVNGATIT